MHSLCVGRLLSGVLLVGTAAIANAAPAERLTSAPVAQCELHVWPSRQLESLIEGFWNTPVLAPWTHVPIKDSSVLLDSKRQSELIPARQIADAFGEPNAKVIIHDAPLSRAEALADSPAVNPAPACLTEIALAKSFLERGALSGRSVRVFAYVRQWDGGKLAWRWSGFGMSALAVKDPKTEAEVPAAMEAIENSWKSAVGNLYVSASVHATATHQ